MSKFKSFVTATAVAIVLAFAATATNANTFSNQDAQLANNVPIKVAFMQKDIIDTARPLTGSNAGDCLMILHDTLDLVYANAAELSTLVSLSNVMVSSQDEFYVNNDISLDIRKGFMAVSTARTQVNRLAGTCGAHAIVATKAQSVLYLLTDVENWLHALADRPRTAPQLTPEQLWDQQNCVNGAAVDVKHPCVPKPPG